MKRIALRGLAALAVGALLSPAAARAQSSPVSELWREWSVLVEQWRLERAEVEADRRRLRARRDAVRGPAPSPAPTPDKGQGR